MSFVKLLRSVLLMLVACATCNIVHAETISLLNVSYDPTHQLYKDINHAFAAQWLKKTGQHMKIMQSHGGSGKQARSVIEGLPADVVTLAMETDIDAIAAKAKLLSVDWKSRLPDDSSPYTSTIVFMVRAGNPKGIKDWGDLVKPGISVITPNPKTSGGARWNYMAAWAWAMQQPNATEASAEAFMQKLYKNVPVMDSGARAATMTFVQRDIGDVLITWENEAYMAMQAFGDEHLKIIAPSVSILAQPSVAVVDKNVLRHGTRDVATAYLQFLYTDEGQEIIAKNFYRPVNPRIATEYDKQFPHIGTIVNIDDFGGWQKVYAKHFADGGVFEKIFNADRK